MKYYIITGITNGLGNSIFNILKSDIKSKFYLIGRNLGRLSIKNDNVKLYEMNFEKNVSEKINDFCSKLYLEIDKTSEIIFINCAGTITPIKMIKELNEQDVIDNYNINTITPIFITKELSKIVDKKGCKFKVINISTGAINSQLSGWSLYASSKAAYNIFLKYLKEESPEYNIVSVDPGVMDTNMQKEIRAVDSNSKKMNYIKQFIKYKEDKTLLSPKAVAEEVVKLYIYDWKAEKFFEKIKNKSGFK